MALFQCQECGCVENSSSGWYHAKGRGYTKDKEKDKKELCSECGPTEYSDGTPTKLGQWHNRFTKKIYPLGSLYTDGEGNVRYKHNNEYPKKEEALNFNEIK